MWKDRWQAGLELAEKLSEIKGQNAIILAIPRGGVPVGAAMAKKLSLPLGLIVVRKIPIPWAPEAGFGAVGPDGSVYLNSRLVKKLGITEEKIQRLVLIVRAEIKRRLRVYGAPAVPAVAGKSVIIVDDGLASGYTAIAAIKTVRKAKPKEVVVAVPVASTSAFKEAKKHADSVIAIIVDRSKVFAVGSFYHSFPDLSDQDVIRYMTKA